MKPGRCLNAVTTSSFLRRIAETVAFASASKLEQSSLQPAGIGIDQERRADPSPGRDGGHARCLCAQIAVKRGQARGRVQSSLLGRSSARAKLLGVASVYLACSEPCQADRKLD